MLALSLPYHLYGTTDKHYRVSDRSTLDLFLAKLQSTTGNRPATPHHRDRQTPIPEPTQHAKARLSVLSWCTAGVNGLAHYSAPGVVFRNLPSPPHPMFPLPHGSLCFGPSFIGTDRLLMNLAIGPVVVTTHTTHHTRTDTTRRWRETGREGVTVGCFRVMVARRRAIRCTSTRGLVVVVV